MSIEKLKEIEDKHQAQINQALEDAKAGNISFDEAKRIVLADTQNAIAELKDLLPKDEK